MCWQCILRAQNNDLARATYGLFGRSRRAQKSQASERREKEAKRLFDVTLVKLAESTSQAEQVVVGLIPPKQHLTALCLKDFKRYVDGKQCTLKRRVATDAEKLTHGITVKAKRFFIDVTYTQRALERARSLIYNTASYPSSSSSSSSTSSTSTSSCLTQLMSGTVEMAKSKISKHSHTKQIGNVNSVRIQHHRASRSKIYVKHTITKYGLNLNSQ